MKLPKKISPDCLIDTFVQIRYIPNKFPTEAVLGVLFNALDDTYVYLDNSPPIDPNSQLITIGPANMQMFVRDSIQVTLQPYSILFNKTPNEPYQGWKDYFDNIKHFIEVAFSINLFKQIDSIGVRYVSKYVNKDIKEIVKYNFSFGFQEVASKTYSFKTEFEFNSKRVILNLHNMLPENPISTNMGLGNLFSTHVDIDVISNNLGVNEANALYNSIQETHDVEKEIFWRLITEEYKQTLLIQY